MRKNLLKFLPLMAAVMIATSCSKDDDTNTPESEPRSDGANTVATETIPFTITVSNGRSLKKMAFKENSNTNEINVSFEKSDEQKLTMRIFSNDNSQLWSQLTLTNYKKGIFSGEIDPTLLNTDVYARIDLTPEKPQISSTQSLTDLMDKCIHVFESEVFRLEEGCTIELSDKTTFYEIIMSPNQHALTFRDGNGQNTVEVNKEGKVWIACAQYFSTNFYSNYSDKGTINTIDRSGYVDLGIYSVLWADKNLGADNIGDFGNRYAWGELKPKEEYYEHNYRPGVDYYEYDYYRDDLGIKHDLYSLKNSNDPSYVEKRHIGMPDIFDYKRLAEKCHWESTTDYNGKAGYIVYKQYEDGYTYSTSKDPHIFFPVEYDPEGLFYKASMYWSRYAQNISPDNIGDGLGMKLELDLDNNNHISIDATAERWAGCYIRPIRDCREYSEAK